MESRPRGKKLQQRNINDSDPIRLALDFALTKLLNPQAKETVLVYLESKHNISISGTDPVTIGEIQRALESFFDNGASVILSAIDQKMELLLIEKQKASVT